MLAGACDYAEAEAEAYAGAAHRSDSKRLAGAGRAVSEYGAYHSGRCKGEEYDYHTVVLLVGGRKRWGLGATRPLSPVADPSARWQDQSTLTGLTRTHTGTLTVLADAMGRQEHSSALLCY